MQNLAKKRYFLSHNARNTEKLCISISSASLLEHFLLYFDVQRRHRRRRREREEKDDKWEEKDGEKEENRARSLRESANESCLRKAEWSDVSRVDRFSTAQIFFKPRTACESVRSRSNFQTVKSGPNRRFHARGLRVLRTKRCSITYLFKKREVASCDSSRTIAKIDSNKFIDHYAVM